MGVCASCLGRSRPDPEDEDEVSRLLFDDQNHLQYGSFGDQGMNAQSDPLESQREMEALQQVVAKTSNNLVDIFEIAPPEMQRAHPAIFSGQEARMARYSTIIAKLSPDSDSAISEDAQAKVEWLPNEDHAIKLHGTGVKDGSIGPLVGTFADAAAAVA